MKTSPKRTSLIVAVPPAELVAVMVAPVDVASCAGSLWRHTPSVPVVFWYWTPPKDVVTVEPGVSKPHTTAGTPRWSTAWSPSEREKVIADAELATEAAAKAAKPERAILCVSVCVCVRAKRSVVDVEVGWAPHPPSPPTPPSSPGSRST
jgi:hypothetical protein